MTELMAQTISSLVEKQFANNQYNITTGLLSSTDKSMTQDEIYAKMLINSMKMSVNLSVQIVSELLLAANVIETTDEEQLRKMLLSVVRD